MLSDETLPESHRSPAPDSARSREDDTMIRYALCLAPRVEDSTFHERRGFGSSIDSGFSRNSQRRLTTWIEEDMGTPIVVPNASSETKNI